MRKYIEVGSLDRFVEFKENEAVGESLFLPLLGKYHLSGVGEVVSLEVFNQTLE